MENIIIITKSSDLGDTILKFLFILEISLVKDRLHKTVVVL
jgi:hypothetical protein